ASGTSRCPWTSSRSREEARVLEVLLPLVALTALGVVGYLYYQARLRRMTRERLALPPGTGPEEGPPPPRARSFPRRHRLVPWLVGAALAAGLYFLTGLHEMYV